MVKRGSYKDHYTFSGSALLSERNGQTAKQTDYIYLNGQLVGIYDGQLSNVINGHLGQPLAMYSETGALVWRGVIDGFDIKVSTQTRPLKARFPGQYDILGNGLYYNYFRDYDPKLGRYVQSDPIGLGGGMNTYGYVGGNPLKFIDPLGLWTVGISFNVSGGAGYGGTGGINFVLGYGESGFSAAMQRVVGGGSYAGANAGITINLEVTDADNTSELCGVGYQVGGSAGVGLYGEANMFFGNGYVGLSGGVGLGAGATPAAGYGFVTHTSSYP